MHDWHCMYLWVLAERSISANINAKEDPQVIVGRAKSQTRVDMGLQLLEGYCNKYQGNKTCMCR